jgi:2-oxoglutarate ferredoxin oxidoreductase subunit gamma
MSGHATIIAGFGGQGLLFAGQVLAQAAMTEGKMVSWMPSYGPEMRGGTAFCTVIVTDGAIGSPVVDVADSVIALNPPSLAKFEHLLAPGGLLVVNTSLIEAEPRRGDLEILAIPCTALARTAGHDRLASVVALGGLVGRRPIVTRDAIRAALEEMTGRHHPELLVADLAAFDAGLAASGVLDEAPAPPTVDATA